MKQLKKCFIIAEIGVNHNNDLKIAKKLVLAAKKCGADAVKFQTFKAETLATKNTPKANYQKTKKFNNESHYEMLKKLELSNDDHFKISKFCKKNKIEFMSTPFDLESLKFLIKLGVKSIKISSADLTDHIIHNYLAKKKIRTIISTGMSNIDEIDQTIKIYKKYKNNKFSLLHCISNYPASDKSLNLKNILTLKNRYNCTVGFSDHSIGNLASLISVGLGAKIIEKHFTLNKKMEGPDHKISCTPNEFGKLVKDIRKVEVMRGSYIKKIRDEEKEIRSISKKSLIYNKNLKKGHNLKIGNLTSIRPGSGLLGSRINLILNKKLKKNVNKNDLVKLNDFKK